LFFHNGSASRKAIYGNRAQTVQTGQFGQFVSLAPGFSGARMSVRLTPTVAEVAKTFGQPPKLLASFATANSLLPLALTGERAEYVASLGGLFSLASTVFVTAMKLCLSWRRHHSLDTTTVSLGGMPCLNALIFSVVPGLRRTVGGGVGDSIVGGMPSSV